MNPCTILACIAISLAPAQEGDLDRQIAELTKKREDLRAQRMDVAGEVAALEIEQGEKATPDGARRLTTLRLQLEDIEEDLHENRHRLDRLEETVERRHDGRGEKERQSAVEHVIDNAIKSVLERVEGTEGHLRQLQQEIEHTIQDRAKEIERVGHTANEALRHIEEMARRLEEEGRHGLLPPERRPGERRARGEGDPYRREMRDEEMDPERRGLITKDRELQGNAEDLSAVYRAMEGEGREQIRDELHKILRSQFDVRAEIREAEIHDLEKKVKALKEEFERRISQRDRLIERRLEDLLEEAGGRVR